MTYRAYMDSLNAERHEYDRRHHLGDDRESVACLTEMIRLHRRVRRHRLRALWLASLIRIVEKLGADDVAVWLLRLCPR